MSDDWGRPDVARWRRLARRSLRPVEDRLGVVFGWRQHLQSQRGWSEIPLPTDQFGSDPGSDETPIFVLAATWRAGSTLLQRLLLSSGEAMVWGEPWNRSDLVPRLRESLRPLNDRWPVTGHVVDDASPDGPSDVPLHQRMVPDLYPPRIDLLQAHRSFFLRLYAEPARARGYQRWGFKETRLGAADAGYLQLLFPRAKLVFVYRNPYDSWSSYVALRAQGYERWPDSPVVSPGDFGDLWQRRVSGYLEYPNAHMTVSYERLLEDPSTLEELADFCELKPDRSTLEHRVGRSHGTRLPGSSMRRIQRAVDPLARDLGYLRPGS